MLVDRTEVGEHGSVIDLETGVGGAVAVVAGVVGLFYAVVRWWPDSAVPSQGEASQARGCCRLMCIWM